MKYTMLFNNVWCVKNGQLGTIDRIEDAPRFSDPELQSKLADYFDSGVSIGTALADFKDHFGSGERTSNEVLTDGTWIWPGHAGYYVRKYGISPGPEFLEYVQDRFGIPIELSRDEFLKVCEETDAEGQKIRDLHTNRDADAQT